MRRSDREITAFDDIVAVLSRCDVVRLALNDKDYPYIVPLNFGMEVDGGVLVLYFHSALEGKKLDLIRADNRASFEADRGHELVSDESKGYCTMNYESVIGRGVIEEITGEQEKINALDILVKKYHTGGFGFSRTAVPHTAVYKLTVSELTGKSRKKVVS